MRRNVISLLGVCLLVLSTYAQDTRLLRQPSISDTHIAFAYGGDIWVSSLGDDGPAKRLSSTPAVESNPHLSPDGKWIAFSSNRSGNQAVYVVPIDGGDAKRLTWQQVRIPSWNVPFRRPCVFWMRRTNPG